MRMKIWRYEIQVGHVVGHGRTEPWLRLNLHELWVGVYHRGSSVSIEMLRLLPTVIWFETDFFVCPLPALVFAFRFTWSYRKRRCVASQIRGGQCVNVAFPGSAYCRHHGGRSE